MKIIVVFICLFLLGSTELCLGVEQDGLQSGTIDFVIGEYGSSPMHDFDVGLEQQVGESDISTALSTSKIGGYIPAIGFEYRLMAERKNLTQVVNVRLWIQNDYRWTFIQVSYLFCYRQDIIVGNAELPSSLWIDNSTHQTASIPIDPVLPSENDLNTAVFLSGLKTDQQFFSIANLTSQLEVETSSLLITFQTIAQAPLDFIAFSYIIYPSTHPIYQFHVVIEDALNSTSYGFQGISLFNGNQIQYLKWRVERVVVPCLGTLCLQTCIDKQECEEKGNLFRERCYLCEEGSVFENGQCTTVQKCGKNQIWDEQNEECVCLEEFYMWQQQCRSCPEGTQLNSNRNGCTCPFLSEIFLLEDQRCLQCPRNSWPNSEKTQCKCLSSYFQLDGACVRCPTLSFPNSDQTTCDCYFSQQIFSLPTLSCQYCTDLYVPNENRTACICKAGYEEVDGECLQLVTCEENEELNDERQCQCKVEFYEKEGACLPIPACPTAAFWNTTTELCECLTPEWVLREESCQPCPSNSSPDNNNGCACNEGYQLREGKCSLIVDCIENAVLVSGVCMCIPGFYLLDNRCFEEPPCPLASIWDVSSLSCQCTSPAAILIDNTCIDCGPNSQPIENECVCVDGFEKVEEECIFKCPENSVWQKTRQQCICFLNNQFYLDGACQQCPQNSEWNGESCVCVENSHQGDDGCILCPDHSTFLNNQCICNVGYFPILTLCFQCHQSCSRCSGPRVNQCTECSQNNFALVDGSCIMSIQCREGFFMDKGKCLPCVNNCVLCDNSAQCDQCADGYSRGIYQIGEQENHFCLEICGDGRRYDHDCDDGNVDNGDGCDSRCFIQSGWQCEGQQGSISTCKQKQVLAPPTEIQAQRSEFLPSKSLFSLRVNHLPECATANNCERCDDLFVLDVEEDVEWTIRFDVQASCQIQVEFSLGGLNPQPFQFAVRPNPDLSDCWTEADMQQVAELTSDPSVFSLVIEEEALTLDDILLPSPEPSPQPIPTQPIIKPLVQPSNIVQPIEESKQERVIEILEC